MARRQYKDNQLFYYLLHYVWNEVYDNEIIVLLMESADQCYIAAKGVFMECQGFTIASKNNTSTNRTHCKFIEYQQWKTSSKASEFQRI